MVTVPLTDSDFNNLSWKQIDGQQVSSLIQGLEVVGAEPVDYPITDGLVLYLKDKAGNVLILDIYTDIDKEPPEETMFYMAVAGAGK